MARKKNFALAQYVGEKVKYYREQKKLTTRDVQAILEISNGHVWAIENGKIVPRPELLLALAGLFQCSITDLLPNPPFISYKLKKVKVEGKRDYLTTAKTMISYIATNPESKKFIQ